MPAVKRHVPVKHEWPDRSGSNYPSTYEYEEVEQSPAPEEVMEPTPVPPRKFPYIPENILNPLLLIILNLCLSSAGTALAAQYIGDEISAVQTETPEAYWWYVVPGWRILKALGAWWGGFDAFETSLLTFLSLAPTTHFLATFHPSLSAYAHASTIAISTLSLSLPMYLLRSRVSKDEKHHHHHKRHHHKHTASMDKSTYITTGLLASSIYASVMYTSLKTFLTRMIVTYFPTIGLTGGSAGLIESVEKVYHPTPLSWGMALPIGFAIAEVVLQKALKEPEKVEEVVEERNKLLNRIWDWFGLRGKVVVKRTAWVSGAMGLDTLVRLAGVMRGGSLEGGAVVSGVWVAATMLTGVVFGWIARE